MPQITDHIQRSLDNMLSQFDDSPKLRELVSILVSQAQDLEDTTIEVLDERLLDVAEGVQLDAIGKLVGRDRIAGESDDDYRTFIRVEIEANRADGRIYVICSVGSKLAGAPVMYTRRGQAHYSVQWEVATPQTVAFLQEVNRVMRKVRPAGVGHELIEGVSPAFRLDDPLAGLDLGKPARRVDVL